ncbi:MAG: rod shape-determining protein MreC [Candidatus Jacksonbacteria bacterium]|nr:rod shape-determining protein MreC [Candidatus Jacksonbacteria bacterium]
MFLSKKISLAFFVFAVTAAMHNLSLTSPLDSLLRRVLIPIQTSSTALAQTANKELSIALFSKRKLLERIRLLEGREAELSAKLLTLKDTARENEELRALLNFQKEKTTSLVLARVIHVNNKDGERIVILDKGASERIEKDDPVVIQNGTLIGKVLSADERSSRVRLTIDSKSAVLATVSENADIIAGIARGSQETTIQLELIPKNIPLSTGTLVYTNGLEEKIPRALFIGTVSILEESNNEIFNTAPLVPPYSIENLSVAGVITSI